MESGRGTRLEKSGEEEQRRRAKKKKTTTAMTTTGFSDYRSMSLTFIPGETVERIITKMNYEHPEWEVVITKKIQQGFIKNKSYYTTDLTFLF